MQTYKLSPSALNLFTECHRCFWLKHHKVWTRPSTPFPGLPNGMDRVLKVHFDNFMEKGQMPPELCEKQECTNTKLFDDKEKLKLWRNSFKGVSFTDKEGNELHGGVDNILVKGKKLIVLDYKTRGTAPKEETANYSKLQQNIYNFLLRKKGYETEDYYFLLFYFPKEVMATGEVIFDTELVKMKVDVNMAEKVWKSAIKLLNSDCPVKSCEWCDGR